MDDPSLFPLLNRPQPQVSDEVFNLFHSIDRELYTRLINMGRDPGESIQIMAFWMWLEREAIDMSFIKRLLPRPPVLINELADEAIICLKCVENDRFRARDEITLLPEFFTSPIFSLRFFHENRIKVVRGVTKIINTVCIRAFNDILQSAWNESAAGAMMGYGPVTGRGGKGFNVAARFWRNEVGESSRETERRCGGAAPPPPPPVHYHNLCVGTPYIPRPPLPPPPGFQPLVRFHPHPPPPEVMRIPIQLATEGSFPAYDFGAQREMIGTELGEMLDRNLVINSMDENPMYNEEEVPADDRTIFLTFSKGYPITQDEVREFFTRKFGDIIEDIIMQEVGEDVQPLYARMVVRPPEVINQIVRPNKAKYSINGKHVWARKYQRKQHHSPNQQLRISASASSSQSAASASL